MALPGGSLRRAQSRRQALRSRSDVEQRMRRQKWRSRRSVHLQRSAD